MKLYAITRGDYSDYHIIALTADKNVAKQLAKRFSNRDGFYGNATIEEYEDGKFILNKELYYVRMEDGNIVDVTPDLSEYDLYHSSVTHVSLKDHEAYYTHVLAESSIEAQKIGKDRIMQYIARRKIK